MRQTLRSSPRVDRGAQANLLRELAALQDMTSSELAQQYQEVIGVPTRSRNRQYLQSQIAWRLQERAEGGLSPRALEQIEQLAPQAPGRWRRPVPKRARVPRGADAKEKLAPDARLPAIGKTITRIYDGVEHQVTVRAQGFEYQGEVFRSLTGIARRITGKSWNGYIFFLGREHGAAVHQEGDVP